MTKKLKIAFQGEPGANSHIAIVAAYPDGQPAPARLTVLGQTIAMGPIALGSDMPPHAGYDETTVWQEFGEMKFAMLPSRSVPIASCIAPTRTVTASASAM